MSWNSGRSARPSASGEVTVEEQAGKPDFGVGGQVQDEVGAVDDQALVCLELRRGGRVRVGDAWSGW